MDKASVSDTLPDNTTKSELLFVHLVLRALDMGGRCAIIVPDGVLFGSSRAHVELRKKLVEGNRLDGVVSMPGGVFKPYAGVSTAVLLFTRGATTDRIWFYDMAHDGFSLDDKRQPVPDNDIPDILECWHHRHDAEFQAARQARLEELRAQVAPLKAERLRLQGEINRLTFESAIASDGDEATRTALDAVNDELAALAQALPQARDLLRPGGRLAVISFHSLEDRLVKQFYQQEARDCLCPPEVPICICQHRATLEVITRKPIRPTAEETTRNPRSRSARLRIAERLGQTPGGQPTT